MIVYHGSYCRVERPELTFSREKLDFGKGFYITPIREPVSYTHLTLPTTSRV